MTNELLPCPFCGGELKIDWSMGLQYWAYCPNDKCCFYETLIYDSVSELVEACNTRAQTVFGMTLDEVRQMMKRDAERERTCQMKDDGRFKYKHGGTGSEAKELFGTEWRTMEKSKCTACHTVTMHDDTIAYSYCPHCGAKVVK